MKKNLRNVLALALGLMTTVSFAQDWNVDSRTRMDMSEKKGEDYRVTTQRVTLGATWGGSDWGIHISSDFNYNLGERALGGNEASMSFDLDMADVSLGYASRNDAETTKLDGVAEEKTNMWLNMGGEFSGWNVNVLYLSNSLLDDAAYGVDIAGGVMGASVSGSMNTDYAGNTMRAINLGYAATDNINLSVGQTAYSDEGQFGANLASDMSAGSWNETGTIGYLGAGDEDITYGLTYAAGGISVGATMHRVTNTIDENYERAAMELNVGYSLGNNASLGLKYITDDNGDATAEESKYTYLTLTVTP